MTPDFPVDDATYFLATMVVISVLIVLCALQLGAMMIYEKPFTATHKARMIVYIIVLCTLWYRMVLYIKGEALVTPAGLGIGTTATMAMIILEYIRFREHVRGKS